MWPPFHLMEKRLASFLQLCGWAMKRLTALLFALHTILQEQSAFSNYSLLHKSHPLASIKIRFVLNELDIVLIICFELVWHFWQTETFLHCPPFTHQAQLTVKLPPRSRVRSWAWSWSLPSPFSGTCWGASGCDFQISLSLCCCHLGALLPLCTT